MTDIKRMGMVFDDTFAYLRVIALPGFREFMKCTDDASVVPGLYIRRFVIAAESLNNALDYFYWEQEPNGSRNRLDSFRKKAMTAVPALAALAEISNAYKHAVRTDNKATIKRSTELIKPPSLSELVNLLDRPEEFHRRISQWITPSMVENLEAGGKCWQSFVDDPAAPLTLELEAALPE